MDRLQKFLVQHKLAKITDDEKIGVLTFKISREQKFCTLLPEFILAEVINSRDVKAVEAILRLDIVKLTQEKLASFEEKLASFEEKLASRSYDASFLKTQSTQEEPEKKRLILQLLQEYVEKPSHSETKVQSFSFK
jgi:hypothetical protein